MNKILFLLLPTSLIPHPSSGAGPGIFAVHTACEFARTQQPLVIKQVTTDYTGNSELIARPWDLFLITKKHWDNICDKIQSIHNI